MDEERMDALKVKLLKGVEGGEVFSIPSKSDAHRLLICAALAEKEMRILCPSSSEDIDATVSVLKGLGADIQRDGAGFTVKPVKEVPLRALLDCRESGSTLRFLLPVAACLGANAVFSGRGRLPLRPMDALYKTLTAGGAVITNECRLPFSLSGKLSSGAYEIGGDISSQYLSGLLMGLPLLEGESAVKVSGTLQSKGYVDMTLHALSRFGVGIGEENGCFIIPGGRPYKSPGLLKVEGDWSNGAFFLVLGALLEKGVLVKGLSEESLQGDKEVIDILERMGALVERQTEGFFVRKGALQGTEIDASHIPDLVPILAVLGAASKGKTTFKNAERLRLKESDRIKTVCEMIGALGGKAEEHSDGLTIWGGLSGGTVQGAGDHRIVMAASVASALVPVTIEGAEAVNKSYPGFFEDLAALGAQITYE